MILQKLDIYQSLAILLVRMEFSCDYCDLKFKFNRSLKSHLAATHGKDTKTEEVGKAKDRSEEEYHCETCGKRFKQKTHLTRHVESLHLGIKYPCKLCDYRASQISNLVTHTETVHEKKLYTCKLCPFEARTRFSVRVHTREVHKGQKGINKKTLQCQTCNKTFAFEKRLVFHMKRQHGILDYRPLSRQSRKARLKAKVEALEIKAEKEEIGEIKISSVQSLQTEEQTPGPQLTSSDNTVNHPQASAGEFSCHICAKTFTQKAHLQVHLDSLHKGMRFPCSHCGKEFRQKPHLQRHVESVHLGVRYRCDQCDHQATQISNLVTHKEMVHENKFYSCKFCDFKAKSRSRIRKHRNRLHKGSTLGKLNKKQKVIKKKRQFTSMNMSNAQNSKANKNKGKTSSRNDPTNIENIQNEVIIEFSLESEIHYCDLCLFDSKEENDLTNHLASEHYEEVLGRTILVTASA